MQRAIAAVLLAAAVVTVAGCGAARVVRVVAPTPRPSEKFEAPQVEVVAYSPNNVRICAPYAVATAWVGSVRGGWDSPPGCGDGLRAIGVDTRALTTHTKGISRGYVHLVGTLDGGIFRVTSQGRPRVTPNPPSPFGAPIPCAAPRGGWHLAMPTREQERALEHYFALAHHHDIVSIAMWHHASILLVTSSHVARVRRVLGAYWPRQLCVLKARYSRATLMRVGHRMEGLLQAPNRPGGSKYGWPTGGGGVAG